jgi:hypothetical protein
LDHALALPPTTGPIGTPQPGQFADRRADREGLDVPDLAEDFKVHDAIIGWNIVSASPRRTEKFSSPRR